MRHSWRTMTKREDETRGLNEGVGRVNPEPWRHDRAQRGIASRPRRRPSRRGGAKASRLHVKGEKQEIAEMKAIVKDTFKAMGKTKTAEYAQWKVQAPAEI